jgi:hypothetical protein
MTTNVVTEANFEDMYPSELRQQFWDRVSRTLKEVFSVNETDASYFVKRYRTSLEGSEQKLGHIIAYHEHPLSVAANLAGVDEVSDSQQEKYLEVFGSDEPTQRGLP